MAHGITHNDTMFSVREKPWHGLGRVIESAPNAEEAIRLAGLNWEVLRFPVWAKTCLSDENDGFIRSDTREALVREDTNTILGIVSQNYRIFQNQELFNFADDLIGEEIKYDTGGSLFGGKRTFVSTKWQRRWSIVDDETELYLLLSNGHTGKDSFKVACTPVRVVCNNTLSLAIAGAKRCWSINHYRTIEGKFREARMTLRLASSYMENLVQYGESCAERQLTPESVEAFVDHLFPNSAFTRSRARENREKSIRQFEICYDAPDIRKYRGTAWGLLNAVSDYAYHRKQNHDQLLAKTIDCNVKLLDRAQYFLEAL